MAKCDVCGNDYDKAFQVTKGGQTRTFDSFECAIHAMAPTCAHCGCKVIGHGVEEGGKIYCCAHCAHHQGATGVRDRA
jgi:Rieske Fe-S protein